MKTGQKVLANTGFLSFGQVVVIATGVVWTIGDGIRYHCQSDSVISGPLVLIHSSANQSILWRFLIE